MILDRCSKGTHDIGKFMGDEMTIELTSQMPVRRPIYRRSQAEMNELEKLNQELLENGRGIYKCVQQSSYDCEKEKWKTSNCERF